MTGPSDKNGPTGPADTPPPDAGDLARRFMDLWQSQVQAMATDPEVADAVRRWTALWTGQGFAPPAGRPRADGLQPGYAPTPTPSYSAGHDTGYADAGDTGPQATAGRPTAGAAPAAPVSGRGGDDLAVVLRELRRLEERIARLEARLERDGGDPESPARRPGGGTGGGRRR